MWVRILAVLLRLAQAVAWLFHRVVGPPRSLPPRTLLEFEAEAKRRLGATSAAFFYFSYVDGEGLTLRRCREVYDGIRLVPRILRDVSSVDTSTEAFGSKLRLPVVVAPTAMHRLATPDGEVAMARGAGLAGIGYSFNWMLSNRRYDEISQEPGVKWLHLYIYEQRDLVQRALELAASKELEGVFSAVIVTSDHPHTRVQDSVVPEFQRSWYTSPVDLSELVFPNQVACGMPPMTYLDMLRMSSEELQNKSGRNDRKLSFDFIRWVKSQTNLPVVVKGVLCGDDAVAAADAGANAVVVSNHGGRQMDSQVPAIEALPSVVKAVKGRGCDVWVDTGIRKSTDVVKALCLGAKGVLLGRPCLWGLACGGSEGLKAMVDGLAYDLEADMMSLGVQSLDELTPDCLFPPDHRRLLEGE